MAVLDKIVELDEQISIDHLPALKQMMAI